MIRLLLFSLFVPYFLFSQVTPKLVEEFKMDIQSASTFDVDALGNIFWKFPITPKIQFK